jgi:hypothetical protein
VKQEIVKQFYDAPKSPKVDVLKPRNPTVNAWSACHDSTIQVETQDSHQVAKAV